MTMSDRIAVMRNGRIEQLGAPEDLYERPATTFVAGFLGISNLLDGEVVGRTGELIDVKLEDGTVVRAPGNGKGSGASVRIGVRPEKLRVGAATTDAPSGAAETNALEGTVIDASYIGVSTQYLVNTPNGNTLTVYAQNLETSGVRDVLADGERVRLTWRPQHTFVIEAAEDHDASPETLEEEEGS